MTPTLLSILYIAYGDPSARLRIRGHNDGDLALTVIHDGLFGLTQHSIAGNGETGSLTVQDNDIIVIHARRDSIVIGGALFQVSIALTESTPLILRPCSISNMDIDQCEFSMVSRATQRAINAACHDDATTSTEEREQVL